MPTELEQRARELFAAEYRADGFGNFADEVLTRPFELLNRDEKRALRAIAAALQAQQQRIAEAPQSTTKMADCAHVPDEVTKFCTVPGAYRVGWNDHCDAVERQQAQQPTTILGSTADELFTALEGAHDLGGPAHERVKRLVEQRCVAQQPGAQAVGEIAKDVFGENYLRLLGD